MSEPLEGPETPGAHHDDDVLVHVDDDWRPARIRQWLLDASGSLWADVSWRDGGEHTVRIPEQRIWTAQ